MLLMQRQLASSNSIQCDVYSNLSGSCRTTISSTISTCTIRQFIRNNLPER
ncbi:hypothetical protein Hanom_Chr13g01239511 [Helianthus anomalus]